MMQRRHDKGRLHDHGKWVAVMNRSILMRTCSFAHLSAILQGNFMYILSQRLRPTLCRTDEISMY